MPLKLERLLLFLMGLSVATTIWLFICQAIENQTNAKYQKLMVECGCAAYDVETGEWYSIETAAAPEPAPIPGPDYMETK
jgi:hypothetical protein